MLPAWLTDTVTTDLDRALHYTGLWGLEGVELRAVGGATSVVPHVNERRVRARLDEHELAVAAVVPGLFEGPASDRTARLNEIATLTETCAFARRVGAPLVVASSFAREDGGNGDAADLLRRAGDVAARHGLRLALLNDAECAHPTGAALAALLDAAGHPAMGAAWSPAEALAEGEAPEAGLAALGARLWHVRVRDGQLDRGVFEDAEVGAGALDWPLMLRTLAAQGYDGALSLEVRAEPRAKTGLRSATALIHAVRAATR
jgi:sugar phosphate isomerase/epimerase